MSCDYCNDQHPAKDCVFPDGNEQILCSRDGLFGDCYIMERKVNYCPMCGEPLSEPEPLSLEQLRQLEGEPVFITNQSRYQSNCRSRWEIIDHIAEGILYIKCADYCYRLDYYGTVWTAYSRKPKEKDNADI